MTPLPSQSPALNVARVSPTHGLVAAGGEDGALECFDLRSPEATTRLAEATGAGGGAATSLRFDDSGMTLALGTQAGTVLLYDLRSSRPLLTKDHQYGLPIVDVKWHTGPGDVRRVISSDTRILKVWDAATGAAFTSVEPEADINDVCIWPGSGLVLLATESKRLAPFFVPALGPAPRWCAFLENLTEEMEEASQPTLYDDYRFVTRPELERLGLVSAIGTPVLRAYMHGFFIDNRLYGKAAALTAPFDYSTYRAQKVKEKLDAERGSHITARRKLPKVNAALAARLMAAGGDEEGDDEPEQREAPRSGGLLKDERFSALFQDSAFAVDESDPTYKALHPNAPSARALLDEHYEDVDEEPAAGREATREPRMYAAKGAAEAAAFAQRKSLAQARAMPLAQRVLASKSSGLRRQHGAQELSWTPSDGGGRGGRGGRGGGRDGGRGRVDDGQPRVDVKKRRRAQMK